MPLKAEAKRLAKDIARIVDDRMDMAVRATATNSRVRESTDAMIDKSRKLFKETAHLVAGYKPTKS